MTWRSEISAMVTVPVFACKARSSMAVPSYRPFVVSLMDKYQGVSEWEQVCDSRGFKSTIRPSTLVRITRKKNARIIAGWGGIEQRERGPSLISRPVEIKCGSWLALESGGSAMRGWLADRYRRQASSHRGPRSPSLGCGVFALDLSEVFFAQLRQIFRTIAAAQLLQRAAHAVQLAVDCLQVVKQLPNGTRHGVRHVFADAVSIEADLLSHGLALGFMLVADFRLDDDPPRNAHNGGARRHGLGHHSIGTYFGTGTHRKGTEHLGARPYHHAITQSRVALAFIPGGAAQRHAFIQGHVITDFGGLANHNAHAMVDKEATPHLGTRVNLDAGQPAAKFDTTRASHFQPMPHNAPDRR